MFLEKRIFTPAEIIDAAMPRDGVLASYNTKGAIFILIFYGLILVFWIFLMHDISEYRNLSDFLYRFLVRDPAENLIGIFFTLLFLIKFAPQAVQAALSKSCAVRISENKLIIFNNVFDISEISSLERSGQKMGIRIRVYFRDGSSVKYDRSFLKGFLWDFDESNLNIT